MIKLYFKTAIVAFILPIALSLPHKAFASEVMDGMRDSVDQMLAVLKSDDSKKAKRKKLDEIINRKFDYVEMARRALARNWKARSIKERKEFSDIFAHLLRNTYLTKIERYSDEKVRFVREKISPKGIATVSTLVIKKEDEIAVDYKLKKKGDKWRCFDFRIENISIIRNYRSQFGKIIKESSYEELLKKMKDKIRKLKAEDGEVS